MLSTATRPPRSDPGKRQSLNVPSQLRALSLLPFEGRQHCGIDVSLSFWVVWHVMADVPDRNEQVGLIEASYSSLLFHIAALGIILHLRYYHTSRHHPYIRMRETSLAFS